MTVTILCFFVLVLGIVLCGVLAEPWQRPRYERWNDEALRRVNEFRLADFDELDALIARDLHREANGE